MKKRPLSSKYCVRKLVSFGGTCAFWPWAGEFVSRNCKADNRLPENLKPKDITERALLTVAPIAAARCRCFASLWAVWRQSGAQSRDIWRRVYCRWIVPRFLEFFKASGFRAAFEEKGALKNMSMIFRCISSSMTTGPSWFRCTFTPDLRSHSVTLPVISGGNSPDNLLNHTVN